MKRVCFTDPIRTQLRFVELSASRPRFGLTAGACLRALVPTLALVILGATPLSRAEVECGRGHPEIGARELACKLQLAALHCDRFPSTAPVRKCGGADDEPPRKSAVVSIVEGCVEGAWGATVTPTIHLFSSAFSDAELQARYYSPEVYQSCTRHEAQGDLEITRKCKLRQIEQFPSLLAKYKDHLDQTSYDELSNAAQLRIAQIKSSEPSLARFIRSHPQHPLDALANLAQDFLDREHEKLQCFTLEADTEMLCEAATYVVTGTVSAKSLITRWAPMLKLADGGDVPAGGLSGTASGSAAGLLPRVRPGGLSKLAEFGDEPAPFGSGSIGFNDPARNKVAAVMTYNMSLTKKILNVGHVLVAPDYRNMRLSQQMLASILAKYPDIKTITTAKLGSLDPASPLGNDNYVIVKTALANGKSLVDAIKLTPAYKVRARLGFGEIIPGSINKNTFGFAVRRPGSADMPGTMDLAIPLAVDDLLSSEEN